LHLARVLSDYRIALSLSAHCRRWGRVATRRASIHPSTSLGISNASRLLLSKILVDFCQANQTSFNLNILTLKEFEIHFLFIFDPKCGVIYHELILWIKI
jgi:hypothetical protein